jgi:molecular chaperone DnaK
MKSTRLFAAEAAAELDRQEKDKINLRNKLESMLKNTQKTYTEFGGLLSENDQEIGQRTLSEVEAAVSKEEIGEIKRGLEQIERLARQLTNAMLRQSEDTKAKGR